MPPLHTERLQIREFRLDDLAALHRLLDADQGDGKTDSLEKRRAWLDWTLLGYEYLAKLHQPPYNDRAITWKSSDEVVGVCGLAPCLGPFWQPEYFVPEVGLYWAVSPPH